jgi:hypothetical protein
MTTCACALERQSAQQSQSDCPQVFIGDIPFDGSFRILFQGSFPDDYAFEPNADVGTGQGSRLSGNYGKTCKVKTYKSVENSRRS